MAKKLSPKRLKFAREYILNGGNATQAAISAGYSKHTADRQGYQLLRKLEVSVYIKEQQAIQDETFKWSKKKAFEALEKILEATNMDNNAERNNYLKAVDTINKLFGTYEPEKQDINHTGIVIKPFKDEN